MSQPSLEPSPFTKAIYSESGNTDSPSLARIKGYALSQWEHAEDFICTMFAILISPKGGTHVAHRAIGSLFSSGGRRELVLGAAEAFFSLLTFQAPDEIKKKADGVHSKIKKHIVLFGDASRRRDEIAHSVVMGTEFKDNKFYYFIVPAYYASRKHDSEIAPGLPKSTYRMNYEDTNKMAELFGALGLRTAEINREISEFYQSLPETLRSRHS